MNKSKAIVGIAGGLTAATLTASTQSASAEGLDLGIIKFGKKQVCETERVRQDTYTCVPETRRRLRIVEETVMVPKRETFYTETPVLRDRCNVELHPEYVLTGAVDLLKGGAGLVVGGVQLVGCAGQGVIYHTGGALNWVGNGLQKHTKPIRDCLDTRCYDTRPTCNDPFSQYDTLGPGLAPRYLPPTVDPNHPMHDSTGDPTE